MPEIERDNVKRTVDVENPVADAIRDATLPAPQLAREAGLSYATLASWRQGRRRPRRQALAKLAGALEAHAERLRALAERLRGG